MVNRDIKGEFEILITEYPVVTILGPRQSGKTTLAKELMKGFLYSNLEIPEVRHFAEDDPKAYLAQFKSKVVIDEIQRVPELLSYIQAIVDENHEAGQFVLTGSHQLKLRETVSQSLAGRTAILHLLPFSIKELRGENVNFDSYEKYCYTGFLPRIYDRKMRTGTVYSNYYQTYVERDVRKLINLKNVSLYEKLIKLMAGRVEQVVDYTSLSNDVGVDQKTIKNWLSILEASFIIYRLPPYFENFGKRVIKSPKYYFMDVGLLCFVLGIRKPDQVSRDPLMGSIFENLVVLECLKSRYNRGGVADLYYFRDNHGNEIDLLYQEGRELVAIEVKAGHTFSSSQLKGLKKFKKVAEIVARSYLVYNGDPLMLSDDIEAIHFTQIDPIFE